MFKPAKNTAVVFIDMQGSFIGTFWHFRHWALVSAQMKLLEYCIKYDIPVVVLEYRNSGDTLMKLRRKLSKVQRHVYFTKFQDDGFENSDVHAWLNEAGIKSLVLTGVNASFCVLETAKGACEYGYKIITADHLMSNCCRCAICQNDTEMLSKHADWYRSNGSYHTNPVPPERLFCDE